MSRRIFITLLLIGLLTISTQAALNNNTASVSTRITKTQMDSSRGTAEVVTGEIAFPAGTDLKQGALGFISSRPDLFKLNQPDVELQEVAQATDGLGSTHIKFNQMYEGLKVWGCQKIAHFNDKNTLYLVGGQTIPTPNVSTNPGIPSSTAETTALTSIKGEFGSDTVVSRSELLVYPENGKGLLSWHVTVLNAKDSLIRWQVFVDAQTNRILNQYSDLWEEGPTVSTGIGVHHILCTLQTYQIGSDINMIDASRPMFVPPVGNLNGVIFTADYNSGQVIVDPNGDNVFNDDSAMQAAVSAQAFASGVYQYFHDVHGWNSWDGQGGTIQMYVHRGYKLNNAYGGNGVIQFGDGDGINYLPFSGSADVIAHELTHSVTGFTANLIYQFESGALNESYSDFFGCMVDSADWLIADDIRLTAPGFMRSCADPHLGPIPTRYSFGYQPAKLSEYVVLPSGTDNGGVHINSGIANKAGYLMGSTIGRLKASQIWFRTLTTYLTPSSGFNYWGAMTIQSAIDLFGDPSPELTSVVNALDSIGFSLVFVTPPEITSFPAKVGSVSDTSIEIRNWRSTPVTIQTLTTAQGKVTVSGTIPYTLNQSEAANFPISFDASTELDSCDIGSIFDTVVFTTSSSLIPTIRIPIRVDLGFKKALYQSTTVMNECLTAGLTNLPGIIEFTRDGYNALAKATLLVATKNGTDTSAYMDLFLSPTFSPVDSINTETLTNGDILKTVMISSIDGKIKGTIKYQYEPSDANGCAYLIADYSLYNLCPDQRIFLSGLIADFDLNTSSTNYANYDVSKKLMYVTDAGNTLACGLALLSSNPRNLRAISNPSLIYDGLTSGEAYKELVATANTIGSTQNDWSALVTFGQDTLGAGDTAHYRAVILYSTTGSSGFASIISEINPELCCLGVSGNVDMTEDVDISDLSALVDFLSGGTYVLSCIPEADLDKSGGVDIVDLSALVDYLTGGPFILQSCP